MVVGGTFATFGGAAAQSSAGKRRTTTPSKVRRSLVQRTIDYIWVGLSSPLSQLVFQEMQAMDVDAPETQLDLLVQALYSLPAADEIGPAALPCAKYPSDHCSIAVKLAWSE